MGRLVNMTVSGALALGLVLSGCGGSSSKSSTQTGNASQTSASSQNAATSGTGGAQKSNLPKEHVPKVTLRMSSPAYKDGEAIPARYTCDGADVSPLLRWNAIPKGTAELALFVTDFNGSASGRKEVVSWAVAGLRPSLKGLAEGALPAGAIVGRNSFGQNRYTVCPPKGSGLQHYLAVLYALPHAVATQPGFAGEALLKTMEHSAEYDGLSGFSYTRR